MNIKNEYNMQQEMDSQAGLRDHAIKFLEARGYNLMDDTSIHCCIYDNYDKCKITLVFTLRVTEDILPEIEF